MDIENVVAKRCRQKLFQKVFTNDNVFLRVLDKRLLILPYDLKSGTLYITSVHVFIENLLQTM